MKITADSSTLYNVAEGAEVGVGIVPLSITIGHENYREFEEISRREFLKRIYEGAIPKSSLPSPGELLDMWDAHPDEDIIHIPMADGLSSSYKTAMGMKATSPHSERITVINSKTLCGPHRYIVKKAAEMAAQGLDRQVILDAIHHKIANTISFLIPSDFDYLRRGGRLNPLKARFASVLRLIPIMTQSADGTQLETFATCRKFSDAIEILKNQFADAVSKAECLISVSHADNLKRAQAVVDTLSAVFPSATFEILELGPAFITQGGPGCVAAQLVLM
ncbi:MAG: DegV family protein [Clostridiales bacterium]|nr:DegV family protein [Clostridiales bacterium]